MLTRELRDLKAQKIINRKFFSEIPPRVKYQLKNTGKTLLPVFEKLGEQGSKHYKDQSAIPKRYNIELLLELTSLLPVHLVNIQ